MVKAVLVWMVVASSSEPTALGAVLRKEGYSIAPPAGFRMVDNGLFEGTRALAFQLGEGRQWLSAALTDGPLEEAGIMTISLREGRFVPSPAAREEFSAAVVRHFSEELGLRFSLESSKWMDSQVEVLGTVRHEHQIRYVLISALRGDKRHALVIFSFPSARWEENAKAVRESLLTFHFEKVPGLQMVRNVVAIITAAAAAALMTSIMVLRRRQRLQE